MIPRQLTVFIHVDFLIGDGQIRHWPLGMFKTIKQNAGQSIMDIKSILYCYLLMDQNFG